jgi:hypothetical protein
MELVLGEKCPLYFVLNVQGDHKVSVHLMITIKIQCEERLLITLYKAKQRLSLTLCFEVYIKIFNS